VRNPAPPPAPPSCPALLASFLGASICPLLCSESLVSLVPIPRLDRAITLATEASNGSLNTSPNSAANQEYESILSLLIVTS
jgi:hypothetical protein